MEVKMAPLMGPVGHEVRQAVNEYGELCNCLVLHLPGQTLMTLWSPGDFNILAEALMECDALTLAGVISGELQERWSAAVQQVSGSEGAEGR